MPEATTTAPPAGWYSDPAGGDGQRWWDGARWTENTIERPVSALVVAPPPPEESAVLERPAERIVAQRQRDLGWLADAASAGSRDGLAVLGLATGASQAAAVLGEDAAIETRASSFGGIQGTGPQPSFGGYVAIHAGRAGVIAGVIALVLVLALAGVVVGVALGSFTVPWPFPFGQQPWMWGAAIVAIDLAAAIVALVVAVRNRASTMPGIAALVIGVFTAGAIAYLQWGVELLH